jgi:glycosyltransferase involved in cell wall biosynthesis
MKVLVVTPTYGRLPFLPRLVASFLSQTYEDKELVIINDDANVIISCDEPNVICLNMNKKILVGQKRNLATQVGYHDLYMHLDDDDIFLPERISNHVKVHQEHPEINLYRNTISYKIYGDCFHEHHNTPNFVSYKRKGWFEMGGNIHNANYAEDLYLLENMKNVLEEERSDQLDSIYNWGGINYHTALEPHSSEIENIAKDQLITMNVFKGEFKIVPDFEEFNKFIKLDKKYKEINKFGTKTPLYVRHIKHGKIEIL